MSKPKRAPFVALNMLLARRHPLVTVEEILAGRVLVDGRVITNPAARVRTDASLRVVAPRRLRGDVKLSYALDTLQVEVAGRVAVDVGSSTGGFASALLDRGARRVYCVDAGVGQLLGRLRLDPRIVNLERTNLAGLNPAVVPELVQLITVDLSYLPLSEALPQLEALQIASDASLIALIKPTFELHRGALAVSDHDLIEASARVTKAAARCGWRVLRTITSVVTGRHGARELFLHATRAP